jgi:hypothetical protein
MSQVLKLRPLDQIVDKWSRRATAAGPDYAAGIQAPRVPWSQGAIAAKDAWKQGVTDAASKDLFVKGVIKAGDAKWLKKASELGVRRYPEGVSAAKDDYKNNFAPFYDALGKVALPPRAPRGDPRNLERVKVIVTTMRQVKEQLLSK